MLSFSSREYVDPVFSAEFDPQSMAELTRKFPPYYQKINAQCSLALKTYKTLLSLQYQTNTWEFATLKASVNLNFNNDSSSGVRSFDIKIAKKVLDKCQTIDEEISSIQSSKISHLLNVIKALSVEEYISDPGTLLLKVYFKVLNLKNSLAEQLNVSYTKAKLLVINHELGQIMEMISKEENPVTLDNTDFQSTLNSYKDFVSVLIDQLDRAVDEKDSEQIEECLGILNDVEKMYESVRMNFFFEEEFNEWEKEQEQQQRLLDSASIYTESSSSSPHTDELVESYQMSTFLNEKTTTTPLSSSHNKRSRRGSMSSTTSSMIFNRPTTTTISEELPYLMQAFDEARVLEQELSNYQEPKRASRQPSMRNMASKTAPAAAASFSSTLSPSPSHSSLRPSKTPTSAPTSTSSTATSTSASSSTSHINVPRSALHPINTTDKTKPHLQSGINTPNMGFSSTLLNNLYGLHPTSTPFAPSNLHNEVD